MSVKDCINAKAAAGKVDKAKTARLVELLDELEADARGSMAPNIAAEEAARRAAIAKARQVKEKKRRTFYALKARDAIAARAAAHPEAVDDAMLSFMDFNPAGEVAGPNIAIQTQLVRGATHARMVDFIDRFRSKAAGLRRRKAGQRNIVRQLFGEDTGDAEARALAAGIREGTEYLRKSFNQAGGAIPARKDWGIWQTHNRRAVAAADKDDWIDFTTGLLDREKMIDLDTGLAMSGARLRRALDDVYDTIATNGMNEIRPGGVARMGMVKRRQESRFLTFRDADAWLAYQDRFGDADVFTLVMGQVDAMSRDIATLQVLGPNPEASLRFMETLIDQALAKGVISKTGKVAARIAGRIGSPQVALRDTFNSVTGALNVPAGGKWSHAVANISAANRNVMVSALLGSAFFSALSDLAFGSITAGMNGIPAARVAARHLKLFKPGADADRRQAIRLGFTAQGWSSMAIAQERYLGEVIGPTWSKHIADFILRASFLSPWTQAGRWGFMTEMAGFITEQVARKFDALPDALRGSFTRHGISQADWDLMRQTPLWKDPETGAEFLRAQDIVGHLDDAAADTGLFIRHRDVAAKLQSAILTESEFAVPSTTARVKAILTGGTQPGSLWGDITRNTTLLKGFPVTLVHTHLQRAAALQGGIAKGKYAAHLVIGTMVMGALAQQAIEIRGGRDFLAMDDPKFWLQALERGGGLGIWGDFLFRDVNRYGGGIAHTLLGPVFGTQVPAVVKLTLGNIQEIIRDGEAKNPGRELTRFVKLMTPGRSLWYANLAFDRLVFDEMQKMLDPNAAQSFRNIEDRARRDRGQRFFSRPGRGLPPQRSPDLAAALGRS